MLLEVSFSVQHRESVGMPLAGFVSRSLEYGRVLTFTAPTIVNINGRGKGDVVVLFTASGARPA